MLDAEREWRILSQIAVEIIYTNETGQWQWAVQFVGTDMWLNAFETNELAVEYCKINCYIIKDKENDNI